MASCHKKRMPCQTDLRQFEPLPQNPVAELWCRARRGGLPDLQVGSYCRRQPTPSSADPTAHSIVAPRALLASEFLVVQSGEGPGQLVGCAARDAQEARMGPVLCQSGLCRLVFHVAAQVGAVDDRTTSCLAPSPTSHHRCVSRLRERHVRRLSDSIPTVRLLARRHRPPSRSDQPAHAKQSPLPASGLLHQPLRSRARGGNSLFHFRPTSARRESNPLARDAGFQLISSPPPRLTVAHYSTHWKPHRRGSPVRLCLGVCQEHAREPARPLRPGRGCAQRGGT